MHAAGAQPGTRYSSMWNSPERRRISTRSANLPARRDGCRPSTTPGVRTVPASYTRADTRVPRAVDTGRSSLMNLRDVCAQRLCRALTCGLDAAPHVVQAMTVHGVDTKVSAGAPSGLGNVYHGCRG